MYMPVGALQCIVFSFVYSFDKGFTVANHMPGGKLVLGELVGIKNTEQAPGLRKRTV